MLSWSTVYAFLRGAVGTNFILIDNNTLPQTAHLIEDLMKNKDALVRFLVLNRI